MEEQPLSENPRKNRARERHQRRKERGGGMAQPSAGMLPRASIPRQLRPTGGIKLPNIALPQGRMFIYGAAAVAFVIFVVLFLGRLRNNTPAQQPNTIWLGTQWTYDNPDTSAIQGLVGRLGDNQIGAAYAWVSLLRANGAWSDTLKFDSVRAFAQQFKKIAPQTKLYGWLSISATGEDGANHLGDEKLQQTVTDFSQRVVGEFGFDGVFLNIVPVADGDENFLALLRKVRAAIGDNKPLAIAVPPDWTPADANNIPLPPRIAPNTFWQTSYKQRVALLADQLAIMAFNTGLTSPDAYSAWMGYQVKAYAQAIADLDTTTEIVIAVPTAKNKTPDHDPAVESITAATNGIHAGLITAGDAAKFIKGIAIYAEWDTDNDAWNEIKSQWVNR